MPIQYRWKAVRPNGCSFLLFCLHLFAHSWFQYRVFRLGFFQLLQESRMGWRNMLFGVMILRRTGSSHVSAFFWTISGRSLYLIGIYPKLLMNGIVVKMMHKGLLQYNKCQAHSNYLRSIPECILNNIFVAGPYGISCTKQYRDKERKTATDKISEVTKRIAY